MPRKREDATRRSFIFSDELMEQIERIAISEHRTMTAQIELFLWEMVQKFDKLKKERLGNEEAEE